MADDFNFGTPLTHDMISKFNASIQPQRMIAESIAAEQDCMMVSFKKWASKDIRIENGCRKQWSAQHIIQM